MAMFEKMFILLIFIDGQDGIKRRSADFDGIHDKMG